MINLTNILQKDEKIEQEEFIQGPFKSGSYSIWSRAYEEELDKKYGITLKDLKNGENHNFSKTSLSKNVRFFNGYDNGNSEITDCILNKYKKVPGFCSMIIKDEKELEEHVKQIHEASYSHYAIGKQNNFEGNFPYHCCGYSSRNLLLNLMNIGYPNASFFYNSAQDHAYIGLPFVINERKGFIIVDPTSDQLFKNKDKAPRNNTFVVFGHKWEYIPDWKSGANLFPSQKDGSSFINLNHLRQINGNIGEESFNMEEYFSSVFINPVEVLIKN